MRSDAEGKRPADMESWTTLSRDVVLVHAAPGSYAERVLFRELDEGVRALDELTELLALPSDWRPATIDVYLVDVLPSPVSSSAVEGPGPPPRHLPPGCIVRHVRPDGFSEPLVWPLTRYVVGRCYGEQAANAGIVVDGIAGVVADRVGSGRPLSDADRIAYDLLTGEPASPVEGPSPEAPAGVSQLGGGDEHHVLATSFVAFLLRSHGPE
ncbi:MAG: hypothetical protein H0U82_01230, partial [Actinobacteria bacterium]|nr:hypothetical protein [Actinomycetota bacterium]